MGVTTRMNCIFGHSLRSGSGLSTSSLCSVPKAHTEKTLYLLWSISLYKVRINLLGFQRNLSGGFGFLEVLTGKPELHILLTELRLQKCPKSCQALWGKCIRQWMEENWKVSAIYVCAYSHVWMYIYIYISIFWVFLQYVYSVTYVSATCQPAIRFEKPLQGK